MTKNAQSLQELMDKVHSCPDSNRGGAIAPINGRAIACVPIFSATGAFRGSRVLVDGQRAKARDVYAAISEEA